MAALADFFTSLANAIRAKGNTAAPLYPSQMPQAIADIQPQINLQTKTKNYTPTQAQQTEQIDADNGYDGLQRVNVNVAAIPQQYIVPAGKKTINENGTDIDVTQYAEVDVNVPAPTPNYQTKSVTPTESAQAITADTNYDALDEVDVAAIPANYVGSGVTRRSSANLTASGAKVTAPAGYYAEAAEKSVAAGSAGTPTATKGTISNHKVTVTPSVTNSAGYIEGGTKTGTGVEVTAAELVSGTKQISANDTGIDVTNYEKVDVAVPTGGSSKNTQVVQGTTRTTSSTMTAIGAELTVSKTGKYDIYWTAFRSNTSGSYTYATQLYIDGVAHGSENATWSNHCQNNHLTGVQLTENQKLRVRGRESRSSSYYIYAPMLVIVEN